MFRRLGRHIKEGFISFFRHRASSAATVFSMFVSLLLVSFLAVAILNLANLTKEVESSLSLSALVEYDLSSSKIKAIEKKLQTIEGVSKVEYRSSEDEFNFYIEQNPDLKEFYETYRDDNPFHANFLVSVENGEILNSIKETISKIDGIDSVHDGGDNTYKLIDILHQIRLIGTIVVAAFVLSAIYLIKNTIKLSIESRSSEIEIMRIVGATHGFIRAPFIIEGLIISFFGSFIALAVTVVGYLYLYSVSDGYLFGAFDILSPYPSLLYVSAFVLGVGFITGFIGSFSSVSKALRKVR